MGRARDASGRFVSTKAKVEFDTSSVKTAGGVVATVSKQMGDSVSQASTRVQTGANQIDRAFGGIARSVQQAQKSVQDFQTTNLGQIQQGLQSAARSFSGISLVAGGLAAAGVSANQQIQSLHARMVVFTGSQKAAVALQKQLRDISAETGQAYTLVAEAAVAVLPAARRAGLEIENAIDLVQRLSVLNSAEGTAGAAFSFRELLSGDLTSIVERFNLGRKDIRAILDQAGGDPKKIAEGLNDLLNTMDITTEAARDLNAEMGTFPNLIAESGEALSTAFAPVINGILLPAVRGITAGLRDLNAENPGLLRLAGGFILATAATGPLLSGLGRVVGLIGQIRAANALTGGLLGNLGVGATAVGVGTFGGLLAARGLADLGVADPRLKSDSGEDPGAVIAERAKQLVVVLADSIVNFSFLFIRGGIMVGNAIGIMLDVFREGALRIELTLMQIIARLQTAVGGQIDPSFQGRKTEIGGELRQIESRRQQGIGLNDIQEQAFTQTFNQMRENIVGGLNSFLFPVQQVSEDVAEEAVETSATLADALKPLGDVLAEGGDKIREVAQEIADAKRDFDADLARVMEDRGIADARDEFDNNLRRARENRDFNKRLADQDVEYYTRRADTIRQYNQQQADLEKNALEQQTRDLANFRREDARRAEDHGRRLEEIRRETDLAVERSASKLDAAGVFDALTRGSEQIRGEQNTFAIENQRRAEDFALQQQQLQENLEKQRAQNFAALQQKLADDAVAFQAQRAQEIASREQRLADEEVDRQLRAQRQQEDRALEDRRRADALNQRISQLQAALGQEIQLGAALNQTVVNVLSQAQGNFARFVGNVAGSVASLLGIQAQQKLATSPAGGGSVPTFAAGGTPPLRRFVGINEQGLEGGLINNRNFALFTQPTTIFPARETQALLAGATGVSGGGGLSIGSFSPQIVLGDIGSRSDSQVKDLLAQGLMETLSEVSKMVRGG